MPDIHDLTVANVEWVLNWFRKVGREQFLAEYRAAGADRASSHFVLWEGRLYDLKAVVYAAYFRRFKTPLRGSPHSTVMRDALSSLADGSIRTYHVPQLSRVTIPEADNGFRTVHPEEVVNRDHFHVVKDFGDGTADSDDQDTFLQRLDDIVADLGRPNVPWIFRDANGGIRKIDKGRARFALNGSRVWIPVDLQAADYLTGIEVGDADGEKTVEPREVSADALGTSERVKATGTRRPAQERFRNTMLNHYQHTCAVTGAMTRATLEAAHIQVLDGHDDNAPDNGVLLRSDVHRLLDRHLITLSSDGQTIEVSPFLTDPHYAFLAGAPVSRPFIGRPPSLEKIAERRREYRAAETERRIAAMKARF
ncbi:hypothetical protein CRT60_00935 [Azospirillum palustre]|uniref:Uncharacterized protein n=1 Tax=Azospirillum palustre TaxID=2044885 RepID=A0A2B8BN97_9PROT|nr:HNH endonuclease signature motif containing protein [Azospirillum palustre]PGH59230.1 hypothetical protein CRT60_00935 [Azospirillum palustre]